MNGKRKRPWALAGVKARIETGWGKMYVGINEDDDGEPFEVFVTIGQSGGLYNSMAEGYGKIISDALRTTDEPRTLLREFAEDLDGIRSDKTAYDNGDEVLSIPDGIAIVFFRYLDGKLGPPPEPVRGDAPGHETIREPDSPLQRAIEDIESDEEAP